MRLLARLALLLSACCLLLYPATGGAAEGPYVCDKLRNDDAYGKKPGYRILIDGRDGTLFRSRSDLKKKFDISPSNKAFFKTFQDELAKRGVTLVTLIPPTRGIMMGDKLTPEQKATHGYDPQAAFTDYLAFLDMLRANGQLVPDFGDIKPPVEGFFYKRDHHWTPDGARLSAEKTAELVKTLPVAKALPAMDFETRAIKDAEQRGSFSAFVREECAVKIPSEPVKKYETAPTKQAQGADDLLGDGGTPQVALVGTSNCTDESAANFPGWLRQSLKTDIDNASVGGGGIDTPMLSYLLSDAFKTGKPKLIVWEVASHYTFKGDFDEIFRQAIPSLYGPCESKALAARSFKADAGGKPLALFPDLEKTLKDQRIYLHLSFDRPIKGPLTISGDAGASKPFVIKRDDRFPDSTEYYYLPDDGSGLSLTLPPEAEGRTVKASLCPVP